MNKKKATPKSSPKSNNQLNNNSSKAQQTRILTRLEEVGAKGLNTIQIRDELNCLCPAPRILELREQGYIICSEWTITEDYCGRKHRVTRYVLIKREDKAA